MAALKSCSADCAERAAIPGSDGAGVVRCTGQEVVVYPLLHWGHREDAPAAQQVLAAIALQQGRADEAAVYMRRVVRDAPRSLVGWRALVAPWV